MLVIVVVQFIHFIVYSVFVI